jgi:predicted RNase H-like HicB family nuclease
MTLARCDSWALRRTDRSLSGLHAHVPELSEVHTPDESLERAREMVRDAIELVLDERRARGEAIPTGWALVEPVEIPA